jgi:hypothetical protein
LRKEVKKMAFGMGPPGGYAWLYPAFWMRQWYPYLPFPVYAYPWLFSAEQEEDFLEGQARVLEEQLAQIKKRLDELKKKEKETT